MPTFNFENVPFSPPKNEAYNLQMYIVGGNDIVVTLTNISTQNIFISKDEGDFTAVTNPLTTIDDSDLDHRGALILPLTADEMNADKIIIRGNILGNTSTDHNIYYVIYTGTSGSGGATAQEVWEYDQRELTLSSDIGVANFSPDLLNVLVTALNLKYLMREVDLDSNTYTYYGFAKTSSVWVIIRENKSSLELTYAIKQIGVNDKRFNQSWGVRTTLTYTSTNPLE